MWVELTISIITLLIRADLLANVNIIIFELIIVNIVFLFVINVIIIPIGVYVAVQHGKGTTQSIISNSMFFSGFFIVVSFVVFLVCALVYIGLQKIIFQNSTWLLYLILILLAAIVVVILIIKGDKIFDFLNK